MEYDAADFADVLTLPDYISETIQHLAADVYIIQVCQPDHISGDPPTGQGGAETWITVRSIPAIGRRVDGGILQALVEIRTYGRDFDEAALLHRMVYRAFKPKNTYSGFRRGNCRVTQIDGGAPTDNLLDEGWPMTLATYTFYVAELS